MLEQNDIKKIEEIIDKRIDPLEKEMGSMKEEMGSMKEDINSIKEEMGIMRREFKGDISRLDSKIDEKFAEAMNFTKQLVLATSGEINQKLDKIIQMNTEDIVTVNDEVVDLKNRVSNLEIKVKDLQAKPA